MTGTYALPGTGPRPALQMGSGAIIDLAEPDPATILIEDLAHAQAYICRFGGHVRKFYSIAQHAMHVAQIAIDLAKSAGIANPERYHLYGLLHDASEGILGCDIPTPLKRYPGLESFAKLQDIHMAAIADRFSLPRGFDKDLILKRADVIAFAVEARDLMGDPEWARVETDLRDRHPSIIPLGPDQARIAYLVELNQALGIN
jgi:hypothetical protein